MSTPATTSPDRTTKLLLLAIVLLLGVLALRPYIEPTQTVLAEARFDHVQVLATNWLLHGRTGVLVMDRRNGNVWHMLTQDTNGGPSLGQPEFVVRVPFEKLDKLPAGQ